MELPSQELGRNGDLSFSFRTHQDEALLVLAKGTAPQVPATVCVTLLFFITQLLVLRTHRALSVGYCRKLSSVIKCMGTCVVNIGYQVLLYELFKLLVVGCTL